MLPLHTLNSLLLTKHYSRTVCKAFGCCKPIHWEPFQQLNGAYCSCFYSILRSSWHATLWPWLHISTQVILVILSLLIEPLLLLINNDLCHSHLPVVSKLICLLKLSLTTIWLIIDAIMFSHKIVSFIFEYWPFK